MEGINYLQQGESHCLICHENNPFNYYHTCTGHLLVYWCEKCKDLFQKINKEWHYGNS